MTNRPSQHDLRRSSNLPSLLDDMPNLEEWLSTLPSIGQPGGLSISEDDKHIYVEAALPGVDPKDIDITYHKGIMWIKGQAEKEEDKKKYYRKATSSFSYRVALPEDTDESSEPEAEYGKGMMKVTFAKSPVSKPKKIILKDGGDK